jgi:thiol reductant ABC exporter CydC subunit
VLLALVAVGVLVPWLASALAARAESRQAAARGELGASVVELLDGAPELLVNGSADILLGRALAADAELGRVARAAASTAGVGNGLTVLGAGLAMWGALLVGVSAVHAGRLDGVLLAGLALIPLVAFELVAGLPAAAQSLQRVRRSVARVQELADRQPSVCEPANPVAIPAREHELHVRGLGASYPGQEGWAVADLDLELTHGRCIAVVGPSGAGKSTLVAALMRFVPYRRGSITLDGVEIAELDGDDYRRIVGLVAQDAHIFDNTIDANLRLASRGATTAELRAALEQVRLLEWVDALPAGLHTELGERGARISGGQRQRLALARALLADFPILLLDEPGEHLDPQTADLIVRDMIELSQAKATLLISHRLLGLEQVDEVIFLDEGRALERGTHAQLLDMDGRYAALWRRERLSDL